MFLEEERVNLDMRDDRLVSVVDTSNSTSEVSSNNSFVKALAEIDGELAGEVSPDRQRALVAQRQLLWAQELLRCKRELGRKKLTPFIVANMREFPKSIMGALGVPGVVNPGLGRRDVRAFLKLREETKDLIVACDILRFMGTVYAVVTCYEGLSKTEDVLRGLNSRRDGYPRRIRVLSPNLDSSLQEQWVAIEHDDGKARIVERGVTVCQVSTRRRIKFDPLWVQPTMEEGQRCSFPFAMKKCGIAV